MNVYDFDNTIYRGDSTADYYFFCLKRHPEILKCMPALAAAFVWFYILKQGNKTQFKEKMFSFLKYTDTEKDLSAFWDTHFSNIKSWYLKQKKEDDVIISASPLFLLKPACDKLGIQFLIASDVDARTGKYTGENCHGKEKVRRFSASFSNREIHRFYSDSQSDAPLAKIAKEAFLVHGDTIAPWKF